MRNVYLFLAASLGCIMIAAMAMISPAAVALDFMNPGRSECSRLLEGYSDSGEWPRSGTAEYAHYMECYMIICEPSPGWW